MRHQRFHGRYESGGRECSWPGCEEAGEFRAPGVRPSGFDGPGDYRWFCLDHVREFNAGYDYFEGMEADEIFRAQSPLHGWEGQSRAFRPDAGVDGVPRWADFADPLEAISGRARAHVQRRRADMKPENARFTPQERRALEVLGLEVDIDRKTLRMRYTRLLRQYHPDHNGGDHGHSARLQAVVEAYQVLRKAAALAAAAEKRQASG
ncbi:J domain-containing protein [Novosphingobium mangrovi (ex Huang et al. 2023)]|uniref:J domain-containing protein n=1 Tax=Novosphingobium mangrovi (ex Huang et al. 2023) TaxID=2976432 RepID=A0ABT2I825_9SPHN|nr:J domain-containing protein [Novosphingobium mangrovi (ex Huang et al. 2023)]MCT2400956.1 J domain-containing protein [Novosphingobium mangrovi (ex Huang et al. 2023)]